MDDLGLGRIHWGWQIQDGSLLLRYYLPRNRQGRAMVSSFVNAKFWEILLANKISSTNTFNAGQLTIQATRFREQVVGEIAGARQVTFQVKKSIFILPSLVNLNRRAQAIFRLENLV